MTGDGFPISFKHLGYIIQQRDVDDILNRILGSICWQIKSYSSS